MMVSIEEELDFLSSYKYLLDTRHGGNIDIDIDIDAEYLQHDIPPMTLQLLIENAVKHNIVSKNKPLKIRIYNDTNQYLVVQNNLQKKRVKPISTGIGLNNIRNRFEYLVKRTILVEEGESYFVVKLPLVKI